MKRTTVDLPDALAARLRDEARRRGVTASELCRDAIKTYLGTAAPRRKLGAAAAGRSGHTDTSERIGEILTSEAGQ